ncbi:MAG TPA: hypothetical protein VJ856_01380 [Paludibacteraceae bacterium]|nr:hypothetical protein [Paludibacteraceae bacterium]
MESYNQLSLANEHKASCSFPNKTSGKHRAQELTLHLKTDALEPPKTSQNTPSQNYEKNKPHIDSEKNYL